MKLKAVLYLLICLFVYSLIPAKASAAGCIPIFGGGLSCSDASLSIQDQVLSPTTNKFVHDLGTTDKFQSNDLVTFQITLTNNGDKPLQNVVVKDTLPTVVNFTDGPGQFDKSTNTLTFAVSTLAAHHSQLFTISGRVTSQNNFPTANNSCVSNNASALASTGTVVTDNSQLCLGKLTSTPATGPEAWELLSLIPLGLVGVGLKRLK